MPWLKKIIDKIQKIIKDPKIIISFLRIKFFNFFQSRKITVKNLELKDIHKGKRCFIVGNGQSINKQDLTLLKNEFTFTANRFYLHKDFKTIHPNFYCLIDYRWFAPPYITFLKGASEIMADKQNIMLFFPAFFKRFIEKNKLFENNKKYYLAFRGPIVNTYPRVYLDITKPISGGNLVAYACLFLAAYMGFQKIYLIGFDHDWQIDRDNSESHFLQPITHQNISPENLLYFDGPDRIRETHLIIKDVFSKKGIKIINATAGGYLDVYERVNYNDFFKKYEPR